MTEWKYRCMIEWEHGEWWKAKLEYIKWKHGCMMEWEHGCMME